MEWLSRHTDSKEAFPTKSLFPSIDDDESTIQTNETRRKKIILKELFLQPLSSQKDSFRSDRPVFSLFYTECVCVRVSMFIVDYKYQKEEKKKKKEDD